MVRELLAKVIELHVRTEIKAPHACKQGLAGDAKPIFPQQLRFDRTV
jgi:hypothetical protein